MSNRYESISYYSQKKWNSSQLLVCGCNLTARRVEGTLRGSPIYLEFNSNTLLSGLAALSRLAAMPPYSKTATLIILEMTAKVIIHIKSVTI